MVPAQSFASGQFTSDELTNSVPLNPDLRLRGEAGANLLDDISHRLTIRYPRVRAMKASDSIRRDATLSMMLANLIVANLNRIDPTRFVATGFANKDYDGTDLSVGPLRQLRDVLSEQDMVTGQRGYHKWGHLGHSELGHLTRLRATSALNDLCDMYGISGGSVMSLGARLIRKTAPFVATPEPDDVTASRKVLSQCNLMLSKASITLPDGDWCRESTAASDDDVDNDEEKSPYRGDLTAVSLYRRFTGNWNRGGRLYGGFWIDLPKRVRPHLMIDGLPTVELDYRYLHPAMLYARSGKTLTFDPYLIPGADPTTRNLGKKTVMRLINASSNGRNRSAVNKVNTAHGHLLPASMSFTAYKAKLLSHLSDISHWFRSDVGVELQREDSLLALRVLDTLHRQGIVVLPIHDSFIVQSCYRVRLRAAMRDAYWEEYGLEPAIS